MDISRRQELFFDGIEISVEMAKVCYSRLYNDILEYSKNSAEKKDQPITQSTILLDSWSLIDLLNRLRILITQTPGLKKTTFVKAFLQKLNSIEFYRDFVQHINGEIPKVEDSGWPIWGSLSWVYAPREALEQKLVFSLTMIPGRLAKCKGVPVVNPAGKKLQFPVDHISLSISSSQTVNLSEIYGSTIIFGDKFFHELEKNNLPRKEISVNQQIKEVYLE